MRSIEAESIFIAVLDVYVTVGNGAAERDALWWISPKAEGLHNPHGYP
jgi:hypothetical protein